MKVMSITDNIQTALRPRKEMAAGARDTFPLIVGAIPFGIIFGTLAVQSGLTYHAALAMSIFVFAGSSQFIALGMVAAGTAWPIVVLTTFVVNLRHLLYTATLLPYLQKLPRSWKLALSFWLTDETFAVAVKRYQKADRTPHKHWYQLGSSLAMYSNWIACTCIGLSAGQLFPGIQSWGLDFAMPATFIGMVIPYLTSRPMWVAVATAGLVALLCSGLPHKLGLMLASVAGIMAGVWAESMQDRENPHE
jgi:4-azaleucine resistance transporter AzlC